MTEVTDKIKIMIGDVVRWGEAGILATVERIRIINSGQCVESFSGDLEDVNLVVRSIQGTAYVWPKKNSVEKVDRAAAKNFLTELGRIKIKG